MMAGRRAHRAPSTMLGRFVEFKASVKIAIGIHIMKVFASVKVRGAHPTGLETALCRLQVYSLQARCSIKRIWQFPREVVTAWKSLVKTTSTE